MGDDLHIRKVHPISFREEGFVLCCSPSWWAVLSCRCPFLPSLRTEDLLTDSLMYCSHLAQSKFKKCSMLNVARAGGVLKIHVYMAHEAFPIYVSQPWILFT